ncbi:zinc-binding alcohol dehydrogenase family protein [Luteibacter sp. 22Crub2.1]|uniref:zinc-binding alcohol dehydrogenase family protein n=1 Tax=Luteibacter sp. 22Crub2.1 TaxID=1283288 RepID=UPI0009A8B844|nr:zinc-binding alcohol dehydrogenase family protein [Luteibacter sp. 22Crub2.1]SKB70085.1 zinc-binding alcohol dehydrogenase family protein [Luteibacter sp. 22Crub2.1]
MKAVVYRKSLPVADTQSLLDVELPDPSPGARDLLVGVEAVSVNPVDTKIRRNVDPAGADKVLGWDVAGTVVAVGDEVTRFKVGDSVWYAGELERPGGNSALHVVDERIVGRKPSTFSMAEAAALPLTALTAWELMFDHMGIPHGTTGRPATLLVVGAAGGVGSIAVQLARRLTGLTVIGTASRPETRAWVESMGAHHVVDHSKPLADEVRAVAPEGVDYVLSLTATEKHYAALVDVLKPQGKLGLIDDPAEAIDVRLMKRKSLSLYWEFMYARSMYRTDDMAEQGRILDEVANLVDAGVIRTTVRENLGTVNADNLRRAHALLESGKAIGKIVLEGF